MYYRNQTWDISTVLDLYEAAVGQDWIKIVIRKELFIINSAYVWLDWGGLYFTEKRKIEICVD